ncbi:phage virion morphogenesis protein [Collimonas arenae]
MYIWKDWKKRWRKKWPGYRYPARPFLGFSATGLTLIRDVLLVHLANH